MPSLLQKLVSLTRESESASLQDDSLRLICHLSSDVLRSIKDIAQTKSVRLYKDGDEIFTEFDDMATGSIIELRISGVQTSVCHVAQNIHGFLAYQDGVFLSSSRPQEWYLIDEDFLSGEAADNPVVAAYERLPSFIALLREIFDFVAPHGTREKFVVLSGKKIEIPVAYTVEDLQEIPSNEAIDRVRDDVLSPPQAMAKKELFKRAVVRFLDDIDLYGRFARLTAGFDVVVRSYEANRDNFFSEFEFEKLAEQFERKRQEFMLKIDAVCGDLLTKVLAVPVGQAIVVSQYKDAAVFGNVALLTGSTIFTLIGIAYVSNQVHSIREIRSNAKREKKEIEVKYPALHARVAGTYGAVLRRVNWYGRVVPALVTALLFAGFLVSLAGFNRMAPCSGCVERAFSWLAGLSG
jgi:hypothetical protein